MTDVYPETGTSIYALEEFDGKGMVAKGGGIGFGRATALAFAELGVHAYF